VVVPSIWWENSPLVIQEARMNHRPVIASGVGGMAEKVRHEVDGLHFPVGDAHGLADTIRRAIESPEMWDRFRDELDGAHPMDVHVVRMTEMYERLLAEVPRGAVGV
jgi:glycosyltransferase involved in cell wall biosynthesis